MKVERKRAPECNPRLLFVSEGGEICARWRKDKKSNCSIFNALESDQREMPWGVISVGISLIPDRRRKKGLRGRSKMGAVAHIQ
jgi:hypothetical protein